MSVLNYFYGSACTEAGVLGLTQATATLLHQGCGTHFTECLPYGAWRIVSANCSTCIQYAESGEDTHQNDS